MKYEERFSSETAASLFNSFIGLCDAVIAGKECAVGLKYDEENMFAPMIFFIETDIKAEVLVFAAGDIGVPVIRNITLAKNLASHGKAGETIPESCYRDVSLALSRLDSDRPRRSIRSFGKARQGIPVKIPRPLSLELGDLIYNLSGVDPGRDKLLAEPLDAIRKKIVKLLGISLPPFKIAHNSRLKSNEYRILFKGIEAGRCRLELDENADVKISAKTATAALVSHAGNIIQGRAPELLGRDEVEAILEAAEEKYPVVTGEVKSLLSLGVIREILQSLVSEQVSIRHVAVILETLADWGSFGPAPSELVIERIRQSLKRQICLEYADDRMILRVLTLEQKLEKRFSDLRLKNDVSLLGDSDNANPLIAPDAMSDSSADRSSTVDYISHAVRGMEEKGFPPVILCSPKARSPLKEATRRKFPELAVLSYLEIPPDIKVLPVGEIRLEGNIRFPGYFNEP